MYNSNTDTCDAFHCALRCRRIDRVGEFEMRAGVKMHRRATGEVVQNIVVVTVTVSRMQSRGQILNTTLEPKKMSL